MSGTSSMGTPTKNKRERPETPSTVLVDENGNDIVNEEEKGKRQKYNEWQRENSKYSLVPFMEKLFDKDGNVFYEPTKENMKFILVPMSSQDIQLGKQAYNFKGVKMESNNLFKGGKKRRTKRNPIKRKHKKSMKMYK